MLFLCSRSDLHMYNSFRQFTERLLRIPRDPEPPPGDEGSTRLFRAAPAYYKYLLLLWALKSFVEILSVIAPVVAGFALAYRHGIRLELLILIPGGIVFTLLIAFRVF